MRTFSRVATQSVTSLTFLLAWMIMGAGCRAGPPSPRLLMYYTNGPIDHDVEALITARPLAPDANIRVMALGRGDDVSHHLVQVRVGEDPHVHRRHDLTVTLLRGNGEMAVGAERKAVHVGDTIFVPRGVVHFFRNHGRDPAVALVTFAPPFEGADRVPVGGNGTD